MPLDEASSRLTTFNTPFGQYHCLHMPFGMSSAPKEFQKRKNDTFGDIKSTAVTADDLLVFGGVFQSLWNKYGLPLSLINLI